MSVIDKDADVAVLGAVMAILLRRAVVNGGTCADIEANRLEKVPRESLLAIVKQASTLPAIATVVCGLVRDRLGAVLPRLVPASVSLVAPFSPPGDPRTLHAVRSAEERRRGPVAAAGGGGD